MKSSPSIWRYVVSIKLPVKIFVNFVAILEDMNSTGLLMSELILFKISD